MVEEAIRYGRVSLRVRTLPVAALGAICMSFAGSVGADEPESYRHWNASLGIVVREQLRAASSPSVDAQSDLFRVVWLGRGMTAPYLGFGGTWALGSSSYRDPSTPDGFSTAIRASIGPSLRLGVGSTYDQGSRYGHSWLVAATFTPALQGAPAPSVGDFPEHGTTLALRPALCVAVPGWPHQRSGAEDYAILLAAMVPSLIDVSIELVPGRNITRMGAGISWEL